MREGRWGGLVVRAEMWGFESSAVKELRIVACGWSGLCRRLDGEGPWKPRLDLISKAVGSLSWMPFKKLDQPILRNKEIDRRDLAGEPPAGKKSRATDFLLK